MNSPERCRFWTGITQSLLTVQMGAVAITLVFLLLVEEDVAMGALVVCWAVAILLHVANFYLTRTGFQAQRYQYTHSLLNHADIRLRLLFHLLTNWIVILLTAVVAWFTPDQDIAQILALVVMITSLLVWISFNLQHKKVNRFNNILLTSVMAVTITLSVFPLL